MPSPEQANSHPHQTQSVTDIEESARTTATTIKVNNEDLLPDAGKVEVGKAKIWGSGIAEDIANTAGTWWLKEMSNFNLTTIAGTS